MRMSQYIMFVYYVGLVASSQGFAGDSAGLAAAAPHEVLSPAEQVEKRKLIEEILILRNEIKEREPLRLNEEDRLLAISNRLTLNSQFGCHANEKIRSFEIIVKGSELSHQFIDETSKPLQPPAGGDAEEIEFRFGPFSETIKGKSILDGKLISDRQFEETIGSLEFLKVRKNGISYRADRTCKSAFLWETCTYKNYEEHLYNITSVQIIANGLVIYERDSMDWNLNRNTTAWEDTDFRNNPAWNKVMSRNDCKSFDKSGS